MAKAVCLHDVVDECASGINAPPVVWFMRRQYVMVIRMQLHVEVHRSMLARVGRWFESSPARLVRQDRGFPVAIAVQESIRLRTWPAPTRRASQRKQPSRRKAFQ